MARRKATVRMPSDKIQGKGSYITESENLVGITQYEIEGRVVDNSIP